MELESETFGQDASFRLEQPIGSMSISPSGRDVVLASKEGLHIIDLDSPYSPPRYLPHRTPWEVADVQWSPFASKDSWIVSTSNQKALVWNVSASDNDAIEYVLHAHSRAITDINFSAHNPEVLATCAVDSFVHGWDLRTPSRPAFSFSDWFAGATQVKFNRQDEHVIASSHDRFLHIWDKRKGAHPARTIEAHGTKIYGLDWNRFEPSKIITCSLDKAVKFWDTNNPKDVPERVIQTQFPVWRARHTPFGWGLLAMPQRGNSDLHLYDRRAIDGVYSNGKVQPVTTFRGQKGQVKEFLWRARGTVDEGIDHRDFQLVSWSTDRELRLHRVHEDTFKAIGYEKGVSKPQRLNFTRKGARYKTFRDGVADPYSPSELPIRTDSIPAFQQLLSARGPRPSTNVGMNKVSVTQFRGWLSGGRRERRTGMHGRTTARQEMNPIAWMKNVKIESWDSDYTDSLADEITQVGDKFKKVYFESVDISQRKAVMSLQGPWGESGLMVYIRIEWRFPKTYPRNDKAVVIVQKTNAIAPNTHKTLSAEVHTIADAYASKQRGCIEAVVRYMLREQSLEQVVSYLLNENVADSKILDPEVTADDLSSESDDENINGVVDTNNSSANIRMPLPKECGAIWSNDGRLICFFPQKPKEIVSVLIKSGTGEEDQTGSWFEGFGRLQTASPARRFAGTQGTNDDAASDTSDPGSEFSSSSSSSSSSEAEAVIHSKFSTYGDVVDLGLRHRSKSGERSNRSTTLDGTRVGGERRLNIVSIRTDVLDLLPSKRILGHKYMIFGNGKEICDHNAKVAEEAILPDIASIWRLAGLILERTVPLDVVKSGDTEHADILFIAQRSTSSLVRKDSGIDLGNDSEAEAKVDRLRAQGRWGNSPLASSYLITAMFNYFERKADIQMLAMLSCVFMQSLGHNLEAHQDQLPTDLNSSKTSQYVYFPNADIALSVVRPSQRIKSQSNKSSTITSYIPSQSHFLAVPNPVQRNQRRLTLQSEVGLHDGSGPRGTPRSGTETPINQTQTIQNRTMSAINLSEDSRLTKRPNSGSVFAASRASLNALAHSYSNSPPSNNSTQSSSLKKPSPSTSLTTGNWSGVLFNRETAGRNSRSSIHPGEAISEETYTFNVRSSISSVNLWELRRDSRKAAEVSRNSAKVAATANKQKLVKKPRKRLTKTVLHNQDRFDLDGYAEKPLLDPQSAWKYKAYRMCYAELLSVWGFVLKQAELLKFNSPVGTPIASGNRRNSSKRENSLSDQGLSIVQCCQDCGKALEPIEKNGVAIDWHCTSDLCLESSLKVSKAQVCSICEQVMHGLTIPCLHCGHITCYDCAQIWFITSPNNLRASSKQQFNHSTAAATLQDTKHEEEETEQASCPTGCGCQCQALTSISVPYPDSKTDPSPIASSAASQHLVPPPMVRKESNMSEASARFRVDPSPDTALGAMMALSSRSRAPSTAQKSIVEPSGGSGNGSGGGSGGSLTSIDDLNVHTYAPDELVPWATGKFTSLGRGIGGGLSRGLSNRSSDATIRKA